MACAHPEQRRALQSGVRWVGLPPPAARDPRPRGKACGRPGTRQRGASRRDTSPAPLLRVMTSGSRGRHLARAEEPRLGGSPEPEGADGEATAMPSSPLRVAVVCSSNQNRSMEAHNILR